MASRRNIYPPCRAHIMLKLCWFVRFLLNVEVFSCRCYPLIKLRNNQCPFHIHQTKRKKKMNHPKRTVRWHRRKITSHQPSKKCQQCWHRQLQHGQMTHSARPHRLCWSSPTHTWAQMRFVCSRTFGDQTSLQSDARVF